MTAEGRAGQVAQGVAGGEGRDRRGQLVECHTHSHVPDRDQSAMNAHTPTLTHPASAWMTGPAVSGRSSYSSPPRQSHMAALATQSLPQPGHRCRVTAHSVRRVEQHPSQSPKPHKTTPKLSSLSLQPKINPKVSARAATALNLAWCPAQQGIRRRGSRTPVVVRTGGVRLVPQVIRV